MVAVDLDVVAVVVVDVTASVAASVVVVVVVTVAVFDIVSDFSSAVVFDTVSDLPSSSTVSVAVVTEVTVMRGFEVRLQSMIPSSPYRVCSQSLAFLKCPHVN